MPTEALPHSRPSLSRFWFLSLPLGLSACSGGVVDLGENPQPISTRSDSRCANSDTLDGPVLIRDQAQLDQLAGCAKIRGDLTIGAFPGTDLSPLQSLTTVEGRLALVRPGVTSGTTFEPSLEPFDGDWLSSLSGLERLDSVGGLTLQGVSAESLAPLAGLRRAGEQLLLSGCPRLHDLSGLEQLQPISDFEVMDCAELSDISALKFAAHMQILAIDNAPVSAIPASDVTSVQSLTLLQTPIVALDGFAQLQTLGNLMLQENDLLTDVNLERLVVADQLTILGNSQLSSLELDSLIYVNAILISGTLVEQLDFSRLLAPAGNGFPQPVWLLEGSQTLEIDHNRVLQRLVLPSAEPNLTQLQLTDNAQLRELDFSGVEAADAVIVASNPQLTQVTTGKLATVEYLELTDNPQLSPAVFAGVRTFDSEVSGNAPSATP